jgi:hypothetical protein
MPVVEGKSEKLLKDLKTISAYTENIDLNFKP